MAINFNKKQKNKKTSGTEGKSDPKATKKKSTGFLLTGKKAVEAKQNEKIKDDQRKAARENKAFRFWMPEDAEVTLTFLDGNLDADGVIEAPMYYEHQLNLAGSWQNWFVCLKNIDQPCPICESGDESKLVTAFTVIDHSVYESKQGKVYKDNVKLFVCKQMTMKLLQKIATKRDGLTGCTFDVSRTGENSAGVGNMFDFCEKNSLKDLQEEFGSKEKTIEPFDYQKVIEFKDEQELRDLGLGGEVIGNESDYSKEL